MRPEDVSAAGLAVHGDRDQAHHVRRDHRGVVVDREVHPPLEGPTHRADVVAPLLAEAAPVPIAPEEGVRREERGHDVQLRGAVELVRAHELGVDDDGAVVGHGIHVRDRFVHSVDHEIHRRVAVGVHDDRDAGLDQLVGLGLVLVGIHHAVGHIVRRRARRALLVRDRDPGRASLGRAVQHELHPGHPETVVVSKRVRHVRGRVRRAEFADEGRDIRLEGLPVGGRLEDGRVLRGDSTVLDGGCAVAQVNVDGLADQVAERLPGRGGPPFERQQSAGGFFQHPVGFHRALDAADQAAWRIRRIGGDVAGREQGGVGRDQVSRHMGEDDGMFGRRAVQILASGMPALLEQRVVVAASGHRLSGRNVVLVDPRPDLAHDVVDVVHVSTCAGAAAEAGELEKDQRHDSLVSSTGSIFYPIVVESLGLWSPNSLQVLKTIARRTSFHNNATVSQCMCNLLQQLSYKLWLYNARMILARVDLDSNVGPSWDQY